jgi:hypothetical protein
MHIIHFCVNGKEKKKSEILLFLRAPSVSLDAPKMPGAQLSVHLSLQVLAWPHSSASTSLLTVDTGTPPVSRPCLTITPALTLVSLIATRSPTVSSPVFPQSQSSVDCRTPHRDGCIQETGESMPHPVRGTVWVHLLAPLRHSTSGFSSLTDIGTPSVGYNSCWHRAPRIFRPPSCTKPSWPRPRLSNLFHIGLAERRAKPRGTEH